MNKKQIFALRIQETMERKKISIEMLSQSSGLSQNRLKNILKVKAKRIPISTIFVISEALDVSTDYLLDFTGPKKCDMA